VLPQVIVRRLERLVFRRLDALIPRSVDLHAPLRHLAVEVEIAEHAHIFVELGRRHLSHVRLGWNNPTFKPEFTLLLMNGDVAGAEQVFRDDRKRNPRNPHSLWGLHQALLQQKRGYDAGFIQTQFEASWRGGTRALKLDDLE
jgi:hypothetical protein